MNRYFSFSATREVAEITPQPVMLRKTQEIARRSLINISGITYPLMQRASMWTYCDEVDDGVVFTFNRQRPFGDIRFEKDLSFYATREPIGDEENPPFIYLEALAWEFVSTMVFFHKVIKEYGRPGTFRIALGLSGLQNAQLDWAGFYEDPNVEREEGILTNWKFQPPKEVVAYESPNVSFPFSDEEEFAVPMSEVIAEVSFAVQGVRYSPFNRKSSRLQLSNKSIMEVIKTALEKLKA